MIPLTKREEKKHSKQDVCHICKKRFSTDDSIKKYHKVRDHCHYTGKYGGAAHDICNLRYKIPKGIPVKFHNDYIYNYHFIIRKLGEEFQGEFACLREKTKRKIHNFFSTNQKGNYKKKIRMAMTKLQKYLTK